MGVLVGVYLLASKPVMPHSHDLLTPLAGSPKEASLHIMGPVGVR